METYCKWCTSSIGDVKADQPVVTYGLCEACAKRLTSTGVMLKEYIDLFNTPIIVVNPVGKICAANDIACKTLGADLPAITGKPPGNIWECIHAHEPGGCGKTVHCKTCVIRMTLTDTMKTGNSHFKVPAYPDVMMDDRVKKMEFLISTERVADVVLVRIDSLKDVA